MSKNVVKRNGWAKLKHGILRLGVIQIDSLVLWNKVSKILQNPCFKSLKWVRQTSVSDVEQMSSWDCFYFYIPTIIRTPSQEENPHEPNKQELHAYTYKHTFPPKPPTFLWKSVFLSKISVHLSNWCCFFQSLSPACPSKQRKESLVTSFLY